MKHGSNAVNRIAVADLVTQSDCNGWYDSPRGRGIDEHFVGGSIGEKNTQVRVAQFLTQDWAQPWFAFAV